MLKSDSSFDDVQSAITLAQTLGKLKKLKRTGWTNYDIALPESVADHSFGVGLLAMFMAKYFNVDADKVLRMALLHDVGEAIIGDVITQRGKIVTTDESEKNRVEREALHSILKSTGNGDDISLFDEYLERKTAEAQFVHQLDKLEMAFQAHQYEQDHQIVLEEFMVNAKKHVTNETLNKVLEEVLRLRS